MMTVQQAAQVLNSEYTGGEISFSSVSTDSRTLQQGDLFIALSGKNFDGNRFVADAEQKGAVAAVIAQDSEYQIDSHIPLLAVRDPLLSLGQLGTHWRERFTMPVIGITGSNGKTTVKEMIASICRQAVSNDSAVLATEGNLNNEIGVPKMLLRMQERHQYAVIEMGMNHVGEIAYLTQLTKPDVALITNAGAAHIEGLGSVETVAHAKGEIFQGLDQDGVAIINADDAYASLWRQLARNHSILDFGLHSSAQVNAEYAPGSFGSDVVMTWNNEKVNVRLQVPGVHNVYNALAAAAAAMGAGIAREQIVAGLESFNGVPGRLQKKMGQNQTTLIDDTYNANPASVRAALDALLTVPGRKFLILGDMGELGDQAIELHQAIGKAAQLAELDGLFTLGELSEHATKAFGQGAKHFQDIDDLYTELENWLAPDVTFLVKGSRFMKMERVVQRFAMEQDCAEA